MIHTSLTRRCMLAISLILFLYSLSRSLTLPEVSRFADLHGSSQEMINGTLDALKQETMSRACFVQLAPCSRRCQPWPHCGRLKCCMVLLPKRLMQAHRPLASYHPCSTSPCPPYTAYSSHSQTSHHISTQPQQLLQTHRMKFK